MPLPAAGVNSDGAGAPSSASPCLRGALPWLLAVLGIAISLRAEVQIERTVMPFEAGPSSFAIGLPGGVSFCFDPVRGGVSYVWTGGFVDLAPARPGTGKFIAPVKLQGAIVHRETGAAPLRRGDPARVPAFGFTGYTLRADAIEFRYTIDGAPVREEIRLRADGRALVRKFDVSAAADAPWSYVAEGKAPQPLGQAGARELVIEIPLGK